MRNERLVTGSHTCCKIAAVLSRPCVWVSRSTIMLFADRRDGASVCGRTGFGRFGLIGKGSGRSQDEEHNEAFLLTVPYFTTNKASRD